MVSRSHRFFSVNVDFKGLLLEGLQCDLHFDDSTLKKVVRLFQPTVLLQALGKDSWLILLAHHSLPAAITLSLFSAHKQTNQPTSTDK